MSNESQTDKSSAKGQKSVSVAASPSAADSANKVQSSKSTASASPSSSTATKKESVSDSSSSGKETKKTGLAAWLLIILLLILVGMLGAAGYFGWGFWQTFQSGQIATQELQQQTLQQQTMQQQIAQLQQQQENSYKEADTVISSMRAELTAIAQRQASHNKRLLSLANTSREDWLLAEAEYLLRLANQRLLIEKDTRAAQGMVETADAILLELDQVDLYPLRKSLASDIVKLKLASKIDKEQLYLRLQALSDNIQSLPLLMEMQRKTAVADMQKNSTLPDSNDATVQEKVTHWLSGRLHSLWIKIKSYVRVREHSKKLEPLLPPESDLFLRQNLRFLLSHAQLAMLQEQPLIYQQSLSQAQQWLRDYYQLSEPAQNFIDELSALAQQNIVQQVPDISASSRELQAYIERLHKVDDGTGTETQP